MGTANDYKEAIKLIKFLARMKVDLSAVDWGHRSLRANDIDICHVNLWDQIDKFQRLLNGRFGV